MKRATILVGAAMLLTLGACSKGNEKDEGHGGPQSAQEVAEEMGEVKIQPGQWQTTQETTDVKIENAPEGMPAGMMDAMKGRKTTVTYCITPEQAEKPGGDFLSGQKDAGCTYSDFSMSGGKISGTMNCTGGQGQGKMVLKMSGSYSPTSYDTSVDMESEGMGDGMKMRISSRTSGKRIGDCPAGEAGKVSVN